MSNTTSILACFSSLRGLRLRAVAVAWIACVVLKWTGRVFGNEFAHDSFNYSPAGSLLEGKGGGGSFGFSSNWYKIGNETNIRIGSGNLISPVPLAPPVGNRVTAAANQGNRWDYRDLSQSLGADNTTTYFSFLMQAQDVVGEGSDDGFFGFYLFAGGRQLSVGKPSFQDVYKVEAGPGEIAFTNVPSWRMKPTSLCSEQIFKRVRTCTDCISTLNQVSRNRRLRMQR
jgi:hypothetical protein